MKRKIMLIGIAFILLIEGVFIYNLFKPSKSQILENIKAVDVFDNKDKTLSIMIQQSDYSYKEDTSRTQWPSTTEYLYAGAKCTDKDGQDIGDTSPYISFEETNHTATITTKKTIYCTLYFANGRPALEVLKAKGGDYYAGGGDHTTAVEGLYRFKGTFEEVDNNYICLGAEQNPDKCKTNTDNMYRIIGVTDGSEKSDLGLEAGMLKVIKAMPLSGTFDWGSECSGCDWDNEKTSIRIYLNDTFYNGILINSRIKSYIAKVNWWKGDRTNATSSGVEKKIKTTSQYRVGLMYAGDYYNSWKYAVNTNSWLHITNGLSASSSLSGFSAMEWTMTRYGSYVDSSVYWEAYTIKQNGSFYDSPTGTSAGFSVRPVFYLTSNVGLVGLGTESNPYTITTIK